MAVPDTQTASVAVCLKAAVGHGVPQLKATAGLGVLGKIVDRKRVLWE